jgi:hypothetical protein
MRILEVTLCTLLAVIATTPLRSNFDLNERISAANGTMMDGGMAFHHDMLGEQSLGKLLSQSAFLQSCKFPRS